MEQENNKDELFNKKAGNIEPESKTLSESIVTIVGVTKKTQKSNGDLMTVPLVNILVKHPYKEDPVSISKLKTQLGDKIIQRSLWVQLDKDENIQKSSAIDDLLKHLKIETLAEITGKVIDTVIESKESNFLCLKAY